MQSSMVRPDEDFVTKITRGCFLSAVLAHSISLPTYFPSEENRNMENHKKPNIVN